MFSRFPRVASVLLHKNGSTFCKTETFKEEQAKTLEHACPGICPNARWL